MSQNTVEITVKTNDQASKGFTQIQKNAEGLKTSFKKVGEAAAGILTADLISKGAAAFKNFVTDSIRQASSLNEGINAVQKTFGDSSKIILDWGKNNAASFGLSTQAFQELATPLGALLKNTGLGMQDVSKWTIDLTTRAADMASVFNTSVPDALMAVQAGLRGETEPLLRYGVNLTAAAVQAEALAENSGKTASQLTAQELATARLNLIMKQTSQTAGDFQGTADGMANASRIASAQFDNMKASLGQVLLPILAKAAQAGAAVASAFNSLPSGVQTSIVVIGALGTAAALLAPKLLAAKQSLLEMKAAAETAGVSFGAIGKAIGVLGTVVAATQLIGAQFGQTLKVGATEGEQAMMQYAETGKMGKAITEELGETFTTVADMGWDGFNNRINGFKEGLLGMSNIDFGPFGIGIGVAEQRFGAMDQALADMVGHGYADQAAVAFGRLSNVAAEESMSMDKLNSLFPLYREALASTSAQQGATTGTTQNLQQSVEQLTKAVNDANAAQNAGVNSTLTYRESIRNLEASYDNMTASIQTNGKTLDEGTAKGRANQTALDNIAVAARNAASAAIQEGAAQSTVNSIMATAKAQFIAAATACGMTSSQAQTLANKLFAIPKSVSTTITAIDRATATIQNVLGRLQWIDGKQVFTYINTVNRNMIESRRTGGITGRAQGGGPRGGGVLVGEAGPEIVEMAPGSMVRSAPDTQRRLAAAGNGNQPLRLEIEWVGGSAGDEFMSWLRKNIRIRGGLTNALGG